MVRPIYVIAEDILIDWKTVNFAARPYLYAMLRLNHIHDKFGSDDATSVILYFLSNASTWRGSQAKKIKMELRDLLNSV